ncbi:MAG: NUDIX hydrolase [archaeon]
MQRKSRPLTVDIIITKGSRVALVKRKFPPYKGCWAIPGGFVEPHETAEQSAVREAFEETGLKVRLTGLLGVYSDPKRDAKRHTAAAAYSARIVSGRLKESNETEPQWFDLERLPKLAFDHAIILRDFKRRKNGVQHK